jgi:hypothetical protein
MDKAILDVQEKAGGELATSPLASSPLEEGKKMGFDASRTGQGCTNLDPSYKKTPRVTSVIRGVFLLDNCTIQASFR